jgi:co-chaperonin GroES (HSP10)
LKILPAYDYLLCEKISQDTGVITEVDIEETHQKYKVLEVGPGKYEFGVYITPEFVAGDVIFVQKHADADNPKALADRDLALIMASRVMAKIGKTPTSKEIQNA